MQRVANVLDAPPFLYRPWLTVFNVLIHVRHVSWLTEWYSNVAHRYNASAFVGCFCGVPLACSTQ